MDRNEREAQMREAARGAGYRVVAFLWDRAHGCDVILRRLDCRGAAIMVTVDG